MEMFKCVRTLVHRECRYASTPGAGKEEEEVEFRARRAKFLPHLQPIRGLVVADQKTTGPGRASLPHSSFKALAEVWLGTQQTSAKVLLMMVTIMTTTLFTLSDAQEKSYFSILKHSSGKKSVHCIKATPNTYGIHLHLQISQICFLSAGDKLFRN